MPWARMLTCESCPEIAPYERGDDVETIERAAERLRWGEHNDRWYCPTCLRAVRSRLGPDALVAGPAPPPRPR